MQGSTSYEIIEGYMTETIRSAMKAVPDEKKRALSEVRLRSGRAVSYVYPDRTMFLTPNGGLVSRPDGGTLKVSAAEISSIVERLSHFSLHSCRDELTQGYFVIENGVRVGVAGTYSSGGTGVISEYNALNFRISRCVLDCGDKVFRRIGLGSSFLICGAVNSGKTTLLRDLCRMYGDLCKVALIDERNEIASVVKGTPTNDVGGQTDIIVNSSRSGGIISAIRTLSPDMIFCDEICGDDDVEAILNGSGSGVKFAATAHAGSFQELMNRNTIRPLMDAEVFDYAVMLEGSASPSEVSEIRRLKKC